MHREGSTAVGKNGVRLISNIYDRMLNATRCDNKFVRALSKGRFSYRVSCVIP